jgi:CheY-like chemotaxis protein
VRGAVAQPVPAEEAPVGSTPVEVDRVDPTAVDPTNELAHLSELPSGEMCDLAQVIPAILKTVQPLLDLRRLATRVDLAEPLPQVTGSPAIVRQMLLNLLTLSASAAQDDLIDVHAQAAEGQVTVQICVPVRPDPPCVREVDTAETVAVTQALAQLAGGTATVAERPDGVLDCRLTLPTIPAARLLAIDDNLDMLRLIERFLQGSHYSVVGVSDPQTALRTAEAIAPRFILLDIMLPEIDGWELLGRLREHPQLGGVPVIVCTFLPQDQLAATVGAAAFLRKPITREALLAVLDHLAQSPIPEAPAGR